LTPGAGGLETSIAAMADYVLNPELVLQQSGTDDPLDFIRLGIAAAKEDDYQRGLIFLAEAHRRLTKENAHDAKLPASALSYYGLCLACHKGRVKDAAEFCQLALEMEFYNAEHYINLGRVWIAGKSRRKAVDALERGLAVDPRNITLQRLRISLGVRKAPVLPFLGRDNPLNVTLGRMRHGMGKDRNAKKF
jgi:tetratricopeptide (TPR) repeat protein